jgi:Tfp pilus assembly protein PilN
MRRRGKTALGIDVSEQGIRLALLRRESRQLILVKTAAGLVPQKALCEAEVCDAAALGSAIRCLVHRNKMQADEAAVGLFSRTMLMQVMDMPKAMPENLTMYVERELKSCIRARSGEICMDYCGIEGRERLGDKRIFAAAADNSSVAALAQSVSRAGVNLKRIEPVMAAYVRALYEKRIARRPRCNVMLVVVREGWFTACVWVNEKLDFVRSRPLEAKSGEDSVSTRLAEQMRSIAKYYQVDVPGTAGRWEVTVVHDGHGKIEGLSGQQGWEGVDINVEVLSDEQAFADSPIERASGCDGGNASTAAAGLAMGLLSDSRSKVEVNLLPDEVVEKKLARRDVLVAANAAAAILLVLTVAVGAWMLRVEHVKGAIGGLVRESHETKAAELVRSHGKIDIQLEQVSVKVRRLEAIAARHSDVDWKVLLEDLGAAAGRNICVTSAASSQGDKLRLRGLALSSEAVNEFVNALEKSRYIEVALLHETQRYEGRDDVLSYEIECVLDGKEGGGDAE